MAQRADGWTGLGSLRNRIGEWLPERVAMSVDPRGEFIQSLLEVSAGERENVLLHALPMIASRMDQNSRNALIQIVHETSTNEKGELVRRLLPLVTPEMCSADSVSIIQEVAYLHPENRFLLDNMFVQKALFKVVQDKQESLCYRGANKARMIHHSHALVFKMLQAVAQIPDNERRETLFFAEQILNPYESVESRVKMIGTLHQISAEDRKSIMALAEGLICASQQMSPLYKQRVILDIASIPSPAERVEIVHYMSLLFRPELEVEYWQLCFSEVAQMSTTERAEVLPYINILLKYSDHRDMQRVKNLIACVTRMPVADREAMITLAMPIFLGGGVTSDAMVSVILCINAMPQEDREDVMNYVYQCIRPRMSLGEIQRLMVQIATTPADQRAARFLWRDHALRQEARLANTINVHDQGRDDRTRDALILLEQYQKDISKEEIDLAIQPLCDYLQKLMNEPARLQQEVAGLAPNGDPKLLAEAVKSVKKALSLAQDASVAYKVLFAPQNGERDFGPLIGEVDTCFEIKGRKFSGREIMGRLWIFTSQLSGLDQENAKYGIIAALKASMIDENERVCHSGKSQRLVVGVLQGRLEGVQVEQEELLSEEQKVLSAVNQFFALETHQKIDTWPDLQAAVETYLRGSKVNRDLFMASIITYAKNQGIEVVTKHALIDP